MTIGKNEVQFSAGNMLNEEMLEHGRDAIHIAVVAAKVLDLRLHPGERVVVRKEGGKWAVTRSGNSPAIGIIDPFLGHTIIKNDIVWVWLMPNTITGLRHTWTHPSFLDEMPVEHHDEPTELICRMADAYDVSTLRLMEAAVDHASGMQGPGSTLGYTFDYVSKEDLATFWAWYEKEHPGVTIVEGAREEQLFSCAC